MANADLIKQLGQAKADVERRAETERALREIGGRIIALRHPEEVLQRSVDEAARLLGADGARIDILDEASGALYWAYDATTGRRPGLGPIGGTGEAKAGEGISGRAVREMRAVFTGDYLTDDRFEHASAPDEHVRKYAIRSVVAVPLIGGEGPLGTLTVYTGETNAFTPDDARLIEALAGQAAIAMTNAKLIEALDQSRAEFSRRADAERALREIAARITAIRDPAELLQHVVDEAARLLNASRARIDLIMPAAGRVGFTHLPGAGDGIGGAAVDEQGRPFTYGASGKAIALGRTVVSTDYFADDGFEHDPGLDEAVRNDGIRSLVVTPLTGEEGLLGVLQVGWPEVGAFDPEEVGLVEAFAHQAAIAIQNARLIEANARSREEIGRRADAERAVREIAADISALRDAEAILQKTVNEARRLLDSDSARIDMLEGDTLTWAFAAGEDAVRTRETGLDLTFKVGEGVAGRVVVDGEAFRTGDYLTDKRFEHIPVSDKLVEVTGFRSVLSAPLRGEAGPLGALSVSSHRVDAYDDAQAGLLQALADQAAIAIQNARLIAELNRSHDELERRADAQQSLREIAAKITAIRESGPLLQQVVDAAKRLVGADGAVLDLVDIDANLLRWTYDSGVRGAFTDEEIAELTIPIGVGAAGIAVAEGRTVTAGDDLGAHFPASEINDRFFGLAGYRSMIVAPITGESGPLGALEVYSTRPGAFDDDDAAVIRSLAYQAAIAITNARLIQELERSQAAVEARAERERSLRDITARITSLREPDEILERVVEESRRLLRSDGAHLTRMADDGTYLVPVIVAGGMDEPTERWLKSMKFSLGAGINGLAAEAVRPIWTYDYNLDPRIPHDPDDDAAAERLGLRGMAAAPLRAPGGEVIGTLAISYREPREIAPDELDLLQGLADQAAIALTNSNLYELLGESEGRYRHLVQNSPDLVWSIDADARFSFVSDTCERLTGWRPDDLLGKHFGALVHASSQEVAELDWTAGVTTEFQEMRGRLNLLHRDGHAIPAEFSAFATLESDGTFAGANGSVRDMSERDRLEGELRASEERYRFLVENSPDVIYAVDAEGRFTYVSETVRRGLGYDPDDLVGQSFSSIVHYEDPDSQGVRFRELQADPTLEITSRLNLVHADGRLVPFEVSAVAATRDGRFDGIHGSARDMSERDRLERELRESEERYRFLVENSPDIVFATDADGLYTYYSESVEQLTGYRPGELVGRHFSSIVDMETFPDAAEAWARFVADPTQMQVNRFALTDREGRRYPVEVSAIGMTDADGRFAGIHGSARDMRERDRLEGELRASAGELASSQERAHLARELHDSVTQALFSMTLVTRTTELLVDRDPAAAKEKLGSLRDLQREALAEMRALIFELRPGNIEQDGLLAALKTHSAALQGRIGLPIVVTSNLVDRLPLALEEVLYRICQEALHNIVKHAAARQVTLSIERTPSGLLVRIVDDGKGFELASVPDGHLGLAGMRARAEKIGASFEVTSKPGAGTTIAVSVPAAAIAAAGATAPVTTGLSSDE
jgi:PAS domain S-box-containing protein